VVVDDTDTAGDKRSLKRVAFDWKRIFTPRTEAAFAWQMRSVRGVNSIERDMLQARLTVTLPGVEIIGDRAALQLILHGLIDARGAAVGCKASLRQRAHGRALH